MKRLVAPPVEVLLSPLLTVVVLLGHERLFSRRARARRAAKRLPRTAIARVEHGTLVKIAGQAWAYPTHSAPHRSMEPIYHRSGWGMGRLPWLRDEGAVDFVVEDGSGQVLVCAARAMFVGDDSSDVGPELIPGGAEVTVIGRVEWEPSPRPVGPEATYREATRRAVMRSCRGAKLVVAIGRL